MNSFTRLIILFVFAAIGSAKSQQTDTLYVHYFENYPYAFTENGQVKGIEADILREYVGWLKQKKNVTVNVQFRPYSEFSTFYNSVRDGNRKVIGLGSVAFSAEREKELSFSPPYLRNMSVLVSQGTVPTVRSREAAEVRRVFGSIEAMAVKNSTHYNYLNALKGSYLPDLRISTAESQIKVLDAIANGKNTIGYVDLIAYWSFVRNNPGTFVKLHKTFSESNEFLVFAMPKTSAHSGWLAEFYESGFGFTSTRVYHAILEKYLGHEVLASVEID